MFKPYSVRKGKISFSEQYDEMNVSTKLAVGTALQGLSLYQNVYDEIGNLLKKLYPSLLKPEIYRNFFIGFDSLSSSNEINTFLEIIFRAYLKINPRYYGITNAIDKVINEINDIFRYRKYMYMIRKNDTLIYPYTDA